MVCQTPVQHCNTFVSIPDCESGKLCHESQIRTAVCNLQDGRASSPWQMIGIKKDKAQS